jgi:hypothetical protein
MPANPKERNFWRLLARHRDQIPQETYDYVFYIVSAAVIGENPRTFGFNFDNPLADLETATSVMGWNRTRANESYPDDNERDKFCRRRQTGRRRNRQGKHA